MLNIAVFYHTFFFLGDPPSKSDNAIHITNELFNEALIPSGLYDCCTELHVGVNGGEESKPIVDAIIPKKAAVAYHGLDQRSELQTVRLLQRWIKSHQDWYVCYFHVKGATHAFKDEFNTAWRTCMRKVIIDNWKKCVHDLDEGYDTVGAHFICPQEYGPSITHPFWGGNFWWATAQYLMTLETLPEKSFYHHPERWIGTGSYFPNYKDYRHHWPNMADCSS